MDKQILTIENHQGKLLNIAGGTYRIIISGAQTNGAFAVIEMSVPAGAGPVPHAHPHFQETFYVLDGTVNFYSEGGSFIAQKGATVSIPQGGTIHNFKNLSEEAASLLCTVVPAGLDDFFVEAALFIEKMATNATPTDIKEGIKQISEKYGQTLFNPDYLNR